MPGPTDGLDLVAEENVRSAYEATFTYHHMIVQARFAALGLYTAVTALLLSSFFTEAAQPVSGWAFSGLGVALTILVYVLDVRNRHLLKNCVSRGLLYEKKLKFLPDTSFFGLMDGPQDAPKSPTLLGLNVISHTFVVNSVLLVLLAVWVSLSWLPR